MKRQEKIEELIDKVSKQHITNIDDLLSEIGRAEYDGDETIEPYADILSPMEWNSCDLCGALYPSDELCWTDYLDPEYDQDLIDTIKGRGEDLCAVCYECVKELKGE